MMKENYCIVIPEMPSKLGRQNYPFTILCQDDEPIAFNSINDALKYATTKSNECALRMEVRTLQFSKESIRPDYFRYIYGEYIIGTNPKH